MPEALFLVAACLFVTEFIVARTAWYSAVIPRSPRMELVLRLLLAGLLLAKLLMEGHTTREWALMAALVAAMGVEAKVTGNRTMLWTILFIVGSRDVSPRKLVLVSLVPIVTILLLTVLLNLLGMSEGITGVRPDGRTRPSLGFKNPNGLGMTCYQICMLLAVLWWQRRPREHLAASVALLVPAWAIADCRSAVMGMALVIALVQATSLAGPRLYERDTQQRLGICCLVLFVACVAASLACVMAPNAPTGILARLDRLLSYRISLSQAYFKLYPPMPFGIDISGLPKVWLDIGPGFNRAFLIDIGYVHVLVHYGVVPFVLYMGMMLALMVRSVREGRCNACLLLVTTALTYGLVETSPLVFGVSPLLICLGAPIHGRPLSSLDIGAEQARGHAPGRHFSGQGEAEPPSSPQAPYASGEPSSAPAEPFVPDWMRRLRMVDETPLE